VLVVVIAGVLETSLYARDLDRAESFYSTVLGLERHSREADRHLFLRCGQGMLLIFNPDATSREDGLLPPHGATGPGHVAFAVADDELDSWTAELEQRGVAIEARIDWPRGGRSVYFRDPAGNSLELATRGIWG
jgi:catechol 2,3-dioxygenase-like lactoylglutathione lyase family enzyme